MSDYGKLMLRIWSDGDFTRLNSREQQVFMMLFSFPTRNLAGVLPLTIRRWAKCSADGTIENLKAALDVLVRERFILIDWDTEEVLIRTYIRNDEVWKQPNLMVRCLKFCETVASEKLRCAISQELARIAQELMPTDKPTQQKIRDATLDAAKSLVKTFPDGFQQGFNELSQDPFWEPFPETHPEPFVEPPGVGGYLGEDVPPAPAPSTDTDTDTDTKPPAGVSKGVAVVEDEKPTKDKRAKRLTDDWQPTHDVISRMKTRYPTIDLRAEFEKFQNHHIGKGTKWVDWNRAWWNWVAEAARRDCVAGGRNGHPVPTSDLRVRQGEALKAQIRARENEKELASGH